MEKMHVLEIWDRILVWKKQQQIASRNRVWAYPPVFNDHPPPVGGHLWRFGQILGPSTKRWSEKFRIQNWPKMPFLALVDQQKLSKLPKNFGTKHQLAKIRGAKRRSENFVLF